MTKQSVVSTQRWLPELSWQLAACEAVMRYSGLHLSSNSRGNLVLLTRQFCHHVFLDQKDISSQLQLATNKGRLMRVVP